MTHDNFEDLLKPIFNQLNNQKVSILCGAGISYNSGLPVVYNFTEAILNKFELSNDEKHTIHSSQFPFEAFIELLQKECRTSELLQIFNKGSYNTNHLFISRLIKNKRVKNIITTNFDELIEQACTIQGLKESIDYRVYRTESEFKNINWDDDQINIIKIHGCASDLESMAINMQMVANRIDSENKDNVVRHFFNRKINPSIIILGYSCSDIFDISPEIEKIKTEQSEIILIEHVFNDEDIKVEALNKQKRNNPFKSFIDGKRLFISTDVFIEKTWEAFGFKNYIFLKHKETDWEINVDCWYTSVVYKNTKAFKHHICSRLFYSLGFYDYSDQHYNKGIAIAYELQKYETAASEIGNLGLNLNARGQYEKAKQCVNTSLDIYRRIGKIEGEIVHLQTLGNIFRNEGNYAEAERNLLLSINLARKDGTESNVCKGLGNLALVYNLTGDFLNAIKCAENGVAIAKKLGIKQSESSLLASLAQAYFSIGSTSKGIDLYQECIKITRQMKNRRNESEALINLAAIYTQQGEFQESLDCLSDALEIALVLGIVQSEGLVYFNMGDAYHSMSEVSLAHSYFKKALTIFEEIYPENHPHTLAAKKMISVTIIEPD